MFLRTVKARGGEGVQHEYVRLVQAYREHGKNKQRIVCTLGRKDLRAEHLEDWMALRRGERRAAPKKSAAGPVQAIGAWDWGPLLVARTLWRALGLQHVLDQDGGRGVGDGAALADRALVLVANRLCAPTSEHGLARWRETDFVCDRRGRRWLPQWRDAAERRASRRPRVRGHFRQLKPWYRTLDQRSARRRAIEAELYLRLRDLFSLKVDCVFYDLTSTYFEGHGPPLLGAHGHSRDGKPRNRQGRVGLGLVDGWPLTHHVFAGNWRDATTVPDVLADLETRVGRRRVVFVGDRGMVPSANLARVREHTHGYVVGLQRRRREAVYRYIERATGPWLDGPVGRAARERAEAPKTPGQEVASDAPGGRGFVAQSEERLAYERTQRLKAMERVRKHLSALETRVAAGKLTAPAKIGAAAARIRTRAHGQRDYDWDYRDGRFRFFEHPVHLTREEAYEGKYVIQTEEPQLTAVEAVTIDKELSDVERAFATLKDVIEMRPIYHRPDARGHAHIFVAALAFLLHRTIEKKLKAAGLDLSSTEALQALRSVRVVDFTVAAREHTRSVTRGTDRAARILAALGITELDPPTPPALAATIM